MKNSEHFRYRMWKQSDAWSLYRLSQDKGLAFSCDWKPHGSPMQSREMIGSRLQNSLCRMILNMEGEPVGSVEIRLPDREITLWLVSRYAEKAACREILQSAVSFAAEEMDLDALWIGVDENSQSHRKLLEACGFQAHHWTLREDADKQEFRKTILFKKSWTDAEVSCSINKPQVG